MLSTSHPRGPARSGDIVGTLAGLVAAYVRRASRPARSARVTDIAVAHSAGAGEATSEVIAVMTLDRERRLRWPRSTMVDSSVALCLRIEDGRLLISKSNEGTVRVDRRNRLRLPVGLARLAGFAGGDRVLNERGPSEGQFVLTKSTMSIQRTS